MAVVLSTPAVAAPCPHEDTSARAAKPAQLAGAFVCVVNRERRRRGLGALDVSHRLEVAALRHAEDMRDNGYFAHDSRDGRTFVDRIRAAGYLEGREQDAWSLGETLAWGAGSAATPARMFDALMDSPPHRRVIVGEAFRELGVGLVVGTPTGDPNGATVAIDYGSLVSPAPLREPPPAETASDRPARGKGRKDRARGPKERSPAPPAEQPAPAPDPAQDSGEPGKDKKDKGEPRGRASASGSWSVAMSSAWAWHQP